MLKMGLMLWLKKAFCPAANFVSELRFDNESELDNILTVLCSD